MYPEEIVLPMREELTSVGFKQVTTSSEIESAIKSSGTTLVVLTLFVDVPLQMLGRE